MERTIVPAAPADIPHRSAEIPRPLLKMITWIPHRHAEIYPLYPVMFIVVHLDPHCTEIHHIVPPVETAAKMYRKYVIRPAVMLTSPKPKWIVQKRAEIH